MEKMMKILTVDAHGVLDVVELPVPQPNDNQALVRIEAGGICGSDRKVLHASLKVIPAEKYPVLIGHEAVGIVEEVGKNVTAYKVGDRVLKPGNDSMHGYTSLNGWGAFAEYGIVNDVGAVFKSGITEDSPEFPISSYIQTVIDPSISPAGAVMVITFREVLAAIRYFGIQPDQSVAVFGCGPVGQAFIRFMRLMGIGPIFAMEIDEAKLITAKESGADHVLNSADGSYIEKIREIVPKGVNYVIDASGYLPIINESMEFIANRGKICCYGVPEPHSFNLDWSKASVVNWQLIFQQFPHKLEESQASSQIYAWIESGALDPNDYISDVMDFEDIIPAYQKFIDGEFSKKCVIQIS